MTISDKDLVAAKVPLLPWSKEVIFLSLMLIPIFILPAFGDSRDPSGYDIGDSFFHLCLTIPVLLLILSSVLKSRGAKTIIRLIYVVGLSHFMLTCFYIMMLTAHQMPGQYVTPWPWDTRFPVHSILFWLGFGSYVVFSVLALKAIFSHSKEKSQSISRPLQ